MTPAEVLKTRWIQQAIRLATTLLEKEEWARTAQESQREISLLIDELSRGFHAATIELKKLVPAAAEEFYEWATNNSEALGGLFKNDLEKLTEAPWKLTHQIQTEIPFKYIEYLFNSAKCLYFKNEFIKADRAFRFLTQLFPQHAEFWIWLGFVQQVRKLPELALISYTIASSISGKLPDIQLYIAQCWMVLKNWDLAQKVLLGCIKTLEDSKDEKARTIKSKCQELLGSFNAGSFPITFFAGSEKEAVRLIASLYKAKQAAKSPKTLSEADWKGMMLGIEAEIKELTPLLEKQKEAFNPHLASFGFFEASTFRFKENGLEIPVQPLASLSTLAACIFLGVLDIGIHVAYEHKRLRELIENEEVLKLGHRLAKSLDKCEKAPVQTISKYLFFYNGRMDMALNERVSDPIFGFGEYSYQESQRDDNALRASLFRKEDIVNRSLLDFGCNEGGVLFACRELGATSITGVDLNRWSIEKAAAFAQKNGIDDARFYVGDMESRAFLSTLPMRDTVLLLAILDTSYFSNKIATIAAVSRFAKHTFYYQGHTNDVSHVQRLYELFIATDFTRFEYLGRSEGRVLIRCSRELVTPDQVPPGAVSTDSSEIEQLNASEIYLFSESMKNPSFSSKCRLIQFIKR